MLPLLLHGCDDEVGHRRVSRRSRMERDTLGRLIPRDPSRTGRSAYAVVNARCVGIDENDAGALGNRDEDVLQALAHRVDVPRFIWQQAECLAGCRRRHDLATDRP